ncbi:MULTISPECIES: HAMP domain-containing sensor histidine kinase [unclassified Paenibacillus]|uniref:sensor histidine kinase n=1 Tax=unclassified Paenibacillus TaxID=185978 RepID=UPI0024073A5C|nr:MULTISPECIES: HAMP domain-containing sensor histidine kinase [unclassified Paenibacillus]MDF9844321.1 signal transduction histidine kinase [Paenibacillus sp. PastF-2]MDF9850890.1 signal transduction histidine kinase [Paenibacillus sp. PastM-2]MDF9857496.1 signal transduction histidine kinase [Paenibacillus sp. PastF-1]MDH6482728.1 signal transduction histidine kinase [Paenibacillus sp. PastH-2]MDH6510154.1 signal transduction histidine kinase [Paenibacillus sp. PastM-3]
MTNSGNIRPNKRLRYIFTAIFLLLLIGYTGTILYLEGFSPALMQLSLLFLIAVLGTGALYNRRLQQQITGFMDTVDEMVDRAIHGHEPLTLFDETRLSSLEHKLLRYIEMCKANEHNLAAEKNTIKELISDISHQTKTPLASILLYSQLLAETPDLSPDTRQLLQQIEAQSEKLEWLITSLIKLSRLETGMIHLQSEVRPVTATITSALSHLYTRAYNKNIIINIDCDPLTSARHDYKWTSEALFNLLENAVKYTEPGGSIRITAEGNEMFTRIEVADTGIGIPEDGLAHIFKRFYRGHNAGEYEGIGIGLFLAQKIISIQGGYITAASQPGQGSRLTIYLPQL